MCLNLVQIYHILIFNLVIQTLILVALIMLPLLFLSFLTIITAFQVGTSTAWSTRLTEHPSQNFNMLKNLLRYTAPEMMNYGLVSIRSPFHY